MDKPLNTRDDTREKLLQAAVEQFAERGFYGASIAQIAGELDLTKQALLYYFKRKEDLYAEVLKRISDRLIELDLDGGGIRALCYDPHLGGFLIISRKPEKSFKLWLWSGDAAQPPKRLKIPDVKNLRRAEGVTPVRRNGIPQGILIVSDDGLGIKGKPGHYLFLRYEQLTGM